MSKYKTIAAAAAIAAAMGSAALAIRDDTKTAWADLKTQVKRWKIKLEIKAISYAGKKNLDAAAAMTKAIKAAQDAKDKNLEYAAQRAKRVVDLQKQLEG